MTVGQLRQELQSQVVVKTVGNEGKLISRFSRAGGDARSVGKDNDNIGSCIADGQVTRLNLYGKAVKSASMKKWNCSRRMQKSTKHAQRVRVGMAYAKRHPGNRSKCHHVLRVDKRDRKGECLQKASAYADASQKRNPSKCQQQNVVTESEKAVGTGIRIWTKIGNMAPVKYERDLDPCMSVKQLRQELQSQVVNKIAGNEGKFIHSMRAIGQTGGTSIGKAHVSIGSCIADGHVLRLYLCEKARAVSGYVNVGSCLADGQVTRLNLGSEAARSASNKKYAAKVQNGGEAVVTECERVVVSRICIWTKMWNSAAVKYERDLDPNMSVAELRKELQVHVVAKTEGTEGKYLKRVCSIGKHVSIGKANANIGSCLRNGEMLRLILVDKKKKNVKS